MSKLILCLLLLFNICICEETEKTRLFTEEDAKNELGVRLGEEFSIKLKSNASTGYSWTLLNQDEVKAGIQLLKKSYENKPTLLGQKPLLGAPGYTVFHFKALRASNGPVSLKFTYAKKLVNNNGLRLTTFKIQVN